MLMARGWHYNNVDISGILVMSYHTEKRVGKDAKVIKSEEQTASLNGYFRERYGREPFSQSRNDY